VDFLLVKNNWYFLLVLCFERFSLLNSAIERFKEDGLNSLKYQVLKKEYRRLYTWVLVSFDGPSQAKNK
jgi:hypothetical protein